MQIAEKYRTISILEAIRNIEPRSFTRLTIAKLGLRIHVFLLLIVAEKKVA